MPWPDNVTLIVEFGFGSGPLAASPTWTDVVADTRAVTMTRGRTSPDRSFTAGSAVVVLDNTAGEYDPNNSAAAQSGNLNLGTPVRIRATYNVTTYTLFYGAVSRWPLQFDDPNESTVAIEVTEALASIRRSHIEATAFSRESSDTRIGNVLDNVGWSAGLRNLATGVSLVEAETFTGSAADLIDQVVEAEQGAFFVAADGDATFLNRVHFSSASAVANFGGAGLTYSDPVFSYDDDNLINSATVTGADDIAQTASDATSLATHGPYEQAATSTNLSVINKAYALNVAEWVVGVNKDVRVRIRGLTLHPEKDAANLWPQVLNRDIGDVVNVKYSPPAGDQLNQDVKIERVRHEIRPGSWVTTWGCYPLASFESQDYWVLDTSLLGTGTVLA